MIYLLVLLVAILVTGCSVGVTHQTEDEDHTEKSSAVERSRSTVKVIVKVFLLRLGLWVRDARAH